MSDDLVTRRDLEQVETKLDRRIDGVETKLDIVARQVGLLTGRVDTIAATMATRDDLAALRAEMATRDDLAALRADMNRDIARHMEAGFEMMRRLFAVHDDRANSIEDKHVELSHEFTEHTRDFVLHNKP